MRSRMIALIAASILPFAGLIGIGIFYAYEEADQRARQTVAYDAELGASQFSRVFIDAKVLLGTLSVMPALQAADRSRCDSFIARALQNAPMFSTMGVIDSDGMIVCHSSISDFRRFGDQDLSRRVKDSNSGELIVGNFIIGPVSKKPVVPVAMRLPTAQAGGSLSVFGSLNLEVFEKLAEKLAGGKAHTVALLETSSRRVLVRWPNTVAFGTQFPENPLFDIVTRSKSAGTTFGVGFDDVHRFFGFAPVIDATGSTLTLLQGLPEDEAFIDVRNRSWWAFGLSLLAFLCAVSVAAAIAFWAQLRPVARLTHFATQIGEGNFSQSVSMEEWQAVEYRRLAATLNTSSARLAEAREAEQKIIESERRFRLVSDNTGDMITAIDNEYRRTFVSGASREVVGYEPQELIGQYLVNILFEDDIPLATGLIDRMRQSYEVQEGRYRVCRSDGTMIWVEVNGRKMDDDSGYVLVMRNITRRKQVEDQLANANARLFALATTDELTQLANRREFNRLLGLECLRSQRDATDLSLLMIDVDRFKLYNDHYGHPAGDACLRAVANAISRSSGRPTDVCARYGGEEFVVILPGISQEDAVQQANTIRDAVRELQLPHAKSEPGIVTISIGIATTGTGSKLDDEQILREADRALYTAKEKGRDRVEVANQQSPDVTSRKPSARRKV